MKTNERESSFFFRFGLVLIFAALGLMEPATINAQWTTPDGSQNINNTNTGNVGIGTTTPGSLLEVKKSQNAATTVTIDNPFTTASNTAYSAFVLKQAGVVRLHIASVNDNHSFITPGTAQFWNFANAPTVFATNNTEQVRISATGNFGIGSNAPDAKLQVHHSSTNTNLANIQLADLAFALRNTSNTNGNMSFLSFQDSAGFGNAQIGAIQMNQATHVADIVFLTRNAGTFGERMRIKSDGTIGIGITTPSTAFHLNSAAAGYTSAGQFLITDSGNTNRHLRFGYDASLEAGWIQASKVGTNYEPLLLNPNGANVGIGTTAPTAKLHVAGDGRVTGNLTVDGNIAAKYQDVAEWVDSSQELKAGTVVILDPSVSNHVIASIEAYDSRVAGVVSLKPGLALGEQADGRVLVATTGRVKVKVDTTNGPIRIGDLLVTSTNAGFAMKSLPVDVGGVRLHRPGTLVGKALEPLATGTGEILVLLSLQ